MSLLDRLLPEPDFVTRDPEALTRELVAHYEQLTGKTLYPAQLERLLVDVIAYRESLVREALQDAAKLNLVRYSRAPVLDYLGENIGVARLPAVKARTTLRVQFEAAPASATLLPEGLLVQGGEVAFASIAPVLVPAGSSSVEVEAQCTQAGVQGNGFVPGQIRTLVSSPASESGLTIREVSNITRSAGGADEESDEQFKERIVLAPEQFSNAGSVGAYHFHARSAHPEVIDVAVVSPSPGVVHLHPLVKDGLPSAAVKAAVLAACNSDRVRPLTDEVKVLDPVVVDYAITARLTLLAGADAGVAVAEARKAAEQLRQRLQSGLGRDVVRDELISAMKVYGVYSVGLVGEDIVLEEHHWPRCTGIHISVAGTRKG
ncbi:phage tail protein [Herbaspirillum seropedicae]|uniref:Bacteriophage tail fiber protein n=1 Tax=Herbaspirillum seropedicae (strain SmR1) TaxID=757424 RepID=D8IV11_HERSS|nr:baseplate J/gp47 family protein [Herbaspirillum seropedicae]ADJ61730.1 bacteriophage tail fiber protein [Herbaspirillum seropedicae SmR1]AKN63935.1 tail fiber protein [Herbaspirillum seropedicae]NQE29306.1 tail fiber protein [Herbaspirillum seropedicae]UMU19845.1 phage tail protein [Herbaspirillum seropedicae]